MIREESELTSYCSLRDQQIHEAATRVFASRNDSTNQCILHQVLSGLFEPNDSFGNLKTKTNTTPSDSFVASPMMPEIVHPELCDELKLLAAKFQRIEVGRGNELWNVGDESDEIYIIESGELELQMSDRGKYRVVESLLRGAIVCCLLDRRLVN